MGMCLVVFSATKGENHGGKVDSDTNWTFAYGRSVSVGRKEKLGDARVDRRNCPE